jgi:hypothetical protein
MPGYSFQNHLDLLFLGLKKFQKERRKRKVISRHLQGKTIAVSGHTRSGGSVSAMVKNRKYGVTNHIAKALKTN